MKKIMTVSFFLFCNIACFAQSPNWLWAKSYSSSVEDKGKALSKEFNNHFYCGGNFGGASAFPTVTLTFHGSQDVYISKIDKNGNMILLNDAGGNGPSYLLDVETDSKGNVYA